MPRQHTATHGSASYYEAGCRCEPCCQWKAGSNARYRARKREEVTGEVPQRVHDAPRSVQGARLVDRQTGEVPMTTGQKNMAKILAANPVRPIASPPPAAQRYTGPMRPPNRRDDDGTLHVPAGWE